MALLGLGLEEKVVVITGGAGGIGSAACAEFTAAGAQVVAFDIDASALDRLAAEQPGIEVVQVDLGSASSVQTAVDGVIERRGRIDVLWNNASIEGPVGPFTGVDVDAFDRTMAINVRSVFLMMQAVLPSMIVQGVGAIINSGSTAAVRGVPNLSAYATSKHAVIGLTQSVAAEVAASGVRVNALCPGPTMTRMMLSIENLSNAEHPEDVRAGWAAAIPRGRYAEPVEIARAALLLASDLASNVTGAVWSADGGATAI